MVLGDSCCNPMSMGYIKKLIEKHVDSVYVNSLKLGENIASVSYGFIIKPRLRILSGDSLPI